MRGHGARESRNTGGDRCWEGMVVTELQITVGHIAGEDEAGREGGSE